MGFVAEFEITCHGLPFVDVAAAVPDATLEVELQPSENWYSAFVVDVVDGATESVELALESAVFVGDYTRIQRPDEVPRYRVEPAVGMDAQLSGSVNDVDALQSLAATDASIERIRVTPTGWIQSGWFAALSTLDEFRSFWQRNGTFTLRRLLNDGGTETPDDGLTEPQREAFQTAHKMGYFEVPRGASQADVAAELGITASSLSERLRRAQAYFAETTIAQAALSEP